MATGSQTAQIVFADTINGSRTGFRSNSHRSRRKISEDASMNCVRRRRFKGPYIASRAVGARHAALIGCGAEIVFGRIDGRTPAQQSHRWSGTTIVIKRSEDWIGIPATTRGSERATRVGRHVVAIIHGREAEVIAANQTVSQNAVLQPYPTGGGENSGALCKISADIRDQSPMNAVTCNRNMGEP